MADSSVTFQTTVATPPSGTVVSTRTNASGEQLQVVAVGIDGSDSVVPSDATNGLDVDVTRVAGGGVAHDGADSGNPVKTGGRARTALPAAVAQDDRSDTITDKHGRTLVANAPIDQRTSGRANYTNTTAADVIAAPGASVILVVTTLLVTNAHATVGTKVEIRDGTTVKLIGQASKDGGGFNLHDPDGLFVATSNTAVTARCVTTGADVEVFVAGFKIPG